MWSTAAYGVKGSKALLAELNDPNGCLRQVRCLLKGVAVVIAAEIEVESVESGELGRLVSHVGGSARHIGELITAVYDGEVPRAVSVREDAEAGERVESLPTLRQPGLLGADGGVGGARHDRRGDPPCTSGDGPTANSMAAACKAATSRCAAQGKWHWQSGTQASDRNFDGNGRRMSQRRRLTILLGLNLAMITALVIVGLEAHSLGVLAAGGDYVADSAAILLGIAAVTIRERIGEHSRAPTYVAIINGSALLIVTLLVIGEALRRLAQGTPAVHGLPVMIVGAIATGVMVLGIVILGTDAGEEDLHMRSVLLDTVSDALASAAVAIGGAVIYFTGRLFWLDSVLAAGIGVVVGIGALRLLRDAATALRRGSPLVLDDT